MSNTNEITQQRTTQQNITKPDYIIKIRTDEKTQKSGRYGYYVVGAAWNTEYGIVLDINFPNPFLVDTQTKITLFTNTDKEQE